MISLSATLKKIITLAGIAVLVQCTTANTASSGTEQTLIVGPKTRDCTGIAPMKCLQIKEKPTDNWTIFYSNIAGFTYEPGFEYVLKVRTEKIANPPADGSSISYTLVKQVSKTKK
ncbi:DUF4377 domain-containing protein [Chryseobacterium daeguense]|uniref:DUF4377 domain-containing protein n=1 Tax=Chryseobacterium daeguense TaxID=412438 RepID=UPI000484EC13|nr:DUF4377 domain-containing protein [Chryseobacterium daeguense]